MQITLAAAAVLATSIASTGIGLTDAESVGLRSLPQARAPALVPVGHDNSRVYGDLAGLPRPAVPRPRSRVYWCRFWQDLPAARAARVPLARWLSWTLRCQAKRALSWDDPLPLLYAGTHAVLRRFIHWGRPENRIPVRADPTHAL